MPLEYFSFLSIGTKLELSGWLLKLRYFEKATKFDKIFLDIYLVTQMADTQ